MKTRSVTLIKISAAIYLTVSTISISARDLAAQSPAVFTNVTIIGDGNLVSEAHFSREQNTLGIPKVVGGMARPSTVYTGFADVRPFIFENGNLTEFSQISGSSRSAFDAVTSGGDYFGYAQANALLGAQISAVLSNSRTLEVIRGIDPAMGYKTADVTSSPVLIAVGGEDNPVTGNSTAAIWTPGLPSAIDLRQYLGLSYSVVTPNSRLDDNLKLAFNVDIGSYWLPAIADLSTRAVQYLQLPPGIPDVNVADINNVGQVIAYNPGIFVQSYNCVLWDPLGGVNVLPAPNTTTMRNAICEHLTENGTIAGFVDDLSIPSYLGNRAVIWIPVGSGVYTAARPVEVPGLTGNSRISRILDIIDYAAGQFGVALIVRLDMGNGSLSNFVAVLS